MAKAMPVRVEYGKDYIAIFENGNEVIYWDETEWKDDSQVVFSIVNAIELAHQGKLANQLKYFFELGGKE